ncbi:DUF4191 domain-containing protein [Yinghuangia seranimata]|uniref:DUF4191 domain-containing protein n=1 Tax=Yinghuangia seranimata TaxID=408067 RepID=UPI00248B42B4|nr:DUF4191 domain-containing protein [Yinghuangia seranimata]MDI2132359.1 DUF4191 domain-containing protein [Yinghuangia seranimata]
MASKESSEKSGRLKQIRLAYQMTKKSDKKVGLVVAVWGLGVFGAFLALGFLIDHPIILGVLGFLFGLVAAAFVFGRRAEKAVLGQMEGTPGAALAVLQSLRRGWVVTPTVAVTRNQDVVHRAVGQAGIVLVGEGQPSRVANLLAAEKRKMSKIADGVVVTDIIVGDGEGQVPLRKLQGHMVKLPRTMSKSQVATVNDRLRALGGLLDNMPVPKGPMPKGTRMPRGPRR